MKEKEIAMTGAMTDKEQAKLERCRADEALRKAEKAESKAREAIEEQKQESRRVNQVEADAKKLTRTYQSLFWGNMILSVTLTFFLAYDKKFFLSVSKWLNSRLDNLIWFLTGFKSFFVMWSTSFATDYKISLSWGYFSSTVFLLMIGVGLFFLGRKVHKSIRSFLTKIDREVKDKPFKHMVSADIILGTLFLCLFCSDSLTKTFHINIVSIWLVLSFLGIVVWYVKEIAEVTRF